MAAVYADLLRAAVEREERAPAPPTVELVRAVARAHGPDPRPGAPGGRMDVAAAVAHELRYDARLVQLCRRFGVEVDLAAFGRPEVERERLKGALEDLGVLPAGPSLVEDVGGGDGGVRPYGPA